MMILPVVDRAFRFVLLAEARKPVDIDLLVFDTVESLVWMVVFVIVLVVSNDLAVLLQWYPYQSQHSMVCTNRQ